MSFMKSHSKCSAIKYNCIIWLPSAEFAKIYKELSRIGDTLVISCTKEAIKFSATSPLHTANITLKLQTASNNEQNAVGILVKAPLKLTFALRNHDYFTKGMLHNSQVQLSMCAGAPLLIEYHSQDGIHICTHLAPKVEEEEDD